MKKLLLIVPMLHQGGFERVCVQTARLLQDRYDVTILLFNDEDINFDITGLNVVNINVPSKDGTLNKIINVFKRAVKTRKYKKEHNIDISYSFGPTANFVNVLSRAGEKTLTGLRGYNDMERPREIRLFCKKSDKVLSCSKDILTELKSDFNYHNGEYIYNPLDVENIRLRSLEDSEEKDLCELKNSGKFIISFMGRDVYIKSLWHMLKAFYMVHEKHTDIELIVLGDGSFDEDRKLAKDLGIEDCVKFLGVKKNPFPYIAASDLFALPSNHEGFPNALIEAMALGKPVIAADCKTGPREIVLSKQQYEELASVDGTKHKIPDTIEGDYGILIPDMSCVPNRNPDDRDEEVLFAKELLKMIEDPQRLKLYGEKALKRAKDFSPEAYRDELDDIFRRLG